MEPVSLIDLLINGIGGKRTRELFGTFCHWAICFTPTSLSDGDSNEEDAEGVDDLDRVHNGRRVVLGELS